MDEEEVIMESPEEAIKAPRDVNYSLLGEGIISWVGFIVFLLGLGSHWLPGGFLMVVSLICGAHALKTAPIYTSARIHAVIGLTLWLAFFSVISLLGIFARFQH
ncbi:hypothetical protein LOC68_23925 [Blastopirellula sp. JC732]|uniref:Uncharacterized protein n=1 Tax=Blastopirellula sediminis TaxID=2894196 RepID=A0A9X1MS52_9BACT|nr:hypothetical protein [Blastopirellula sediminis]MCC9605245.1 hypothetical protein [Blastopirellula sediminis]MCC9631455.1 hypothetical protein [Blastopirellula sediminis]